MERGAYGTKREQTRDKILSAAMELFAHKGLVATSAQEIAKKAGISVGLMYHYYKTKEDVFSALIKTSVEELIQFRNALNESGCPLLALKEMAEEIVGEMKENLELSNWVMMLSWLSPTPEDKRFSDFVQDYQNGFVSEIENLIKLGQEQGKFVEGNPKQLTLFLFAIMQGICSLQLALKEDFIVPSADMLLAYLIR